MNGKYFWGLCAAVLIVGAVVSIAAGKWEGAVAAVVIAAGAARLMIVGTDRKPPGDPTKTGLDSLRKKRQ
jgi:uncharacterized membrane protein